MTEGSNFKEARIKEENASEGSIEEIKENATRQDAYVVFSNEKDLRHNEAIRIKASLYTGIALRVKIISPAAMENLLYAIDLDAGIARKQASQAAMEEAKKEKKKKGEESKSGVKDKDSNTVASSNPDIVPSIPPSQQAKGGVVNLRFEECKIQKKAAYILSEWLKNKALIETLGLIKVTFEDVHDFKKITEGIKLNHKLLKVSFQHMNLDEEIHGTAIGRVLSDSRTIRELDMTHIVFDYRSFYDMCQAILNERCRLSVLKLRGLQVGEIEGKIIQFILMKNKTIHTLDLSECRTEDPQNFEHFCEKINQFCNIRFLTMEKMQPDLSQNIDTVGEALAENTKLEVLILRDNKIKWVNYQNFFTNLMPNRTIQKLNLCKTDLSDRVVERLAQYLEQPGLALADLDLSKNNITDAGLKILASALQSNQSLQFFNMAQNKCKEEGFLDFSDLLKVNTTLVEVSFGQNIISNEGLSFLAQMLPVNKTLRHLDLSRNQFNDTGFEDFAENLANNQGLQFLDIAKNKDITDEGSLIVLCDSLAINKHLKTLDLTGLTVRKPFLKQNFDQALKRNITLQEVIGKIPANIISAELEQNVVIEKELLPLYQPTYKPRKEEFNLALVESSNENRSRLNLHEQPPRLLKAAFKLIRNYDIRAVDFTAAGIHDDSMRMLSLYLRNDPNLRSIVLDKNMFTDDGLQKLTKELERNTKLAHLSIKGCTNLTNQGLQRLCDVISTTNTSLFQIDLDVDQFDQQLANLVITESSLNRDIQEKLRPMKVVTIYDSKGNIIKQTIGSGLQDAEPSKGVNSGKGSDSEDENTIKNGAMSPTSDKTAEAGTEIILNNDVTGETDSSSVNKALQSRQMVMSRTGALSGDDLAGCRTVVEVKFDENARVSECFQSAIKSWRINEPNVISLEKQDLGDEHCEKLTDFLAGREMLTHLNLRRNLIGNAGAKSLGDFIQEKDNSLTHIDVTRNCIGQDGGQAILDALYATTRIIDCQIKYGNPISNKMGRVIEREIKANIQADTYTAKHREKSEAQKYELVDKGPDYMRCAIKMAQLHNILFLSLPDNMLALEDARMLAQLLKRDTPLRKLNLQDNKLDADCAGLLANALIYNSNLEVLELSRNVLGDLGVYLILTPLINKSLLEQNIKSKAVPVLREKVMVQDKNVKFSKRIIKNIDIKTELQYIGLEENQTTLEVYKQIWLLLVLNQEVIIKVDNPNHIKKRDEAEAAPKTSARAISPMLSDQGAVNTKGSDRPGSALIPNTSAQKVAPMDSISNIDNSSAMLLDGGRHGSNRSDDEADKDSIPESEDEIDEEQLLELERLAIEKEKERKLAEKREKAHARRKKSIVCCQKFCCFKDYDNEFNLSDKMPSYMQVCCWRFLRSRRASTKFHTSENTLNGIERSGYSVFVSLLISFNYLMLYAVVIVPFVLIATAEEIQSITVDGVELPCEEVEDNCASAKEDARVNFNDFVLMINAAVLIYFSICETVIICVNLKASSTKCGAYLICQVITGLTMRSVILISAQLIAVFIQEVDLMNYSLGILLTVTLVLSQIRSVQVWFASIKADKNCLLPRVKQNFRICISTNYLAAATIYDKVSVEATERANDQAKAIDEERERLMKFSGFADEDNKTSMKEQTKANLAKKCKCCRWTSPKFYQLIMNDIPLSVCLPFAMMFELMDLFNAGLMTMLIVTDIVFMLFYLSYDEELSIDATTVYELADKRCRDKEEVVVKILSDQISVSDVDIGQMSAGSDDIVNLEEPELDENQIVVTDHENNENKIEGELPKLVVSDRGGKLGAVFDGLKNSADSKMSNESNHQDIRVQSLDIDDTTNRAGLPPINTGSEKGAFNHVV